MACKENDFDSEILKKISGEFGKKLSRAIRFSPPEDTAGMQRLAAGLNALSKSLAVIQKFETEGAVPIRNYSPYLEVDDD